LGGSHGNNPFPTVRRPARPPGVALRHRDHPRHRRRLRDTTDDRRPDWATKLHHRQL